MALKFDVRAFQVDLSATFAEPAFELAENRGQLIKAVHSRLAPHGLPLSEIRAGAIGKLDDPVLTCAALNWAANFVIRVDRVDVTCFDRAVAEQLNSVFPAVVDAVLGIVPGATAEAYSSEVSAHVALPVGELENTFRVFWPAKAPAGLATPTGVGSIFSFGPDGNRVSARLFLDRSLTVEGGIFVSVTTTYKVRPADFLEHFAAILSALGFEKHA